MVQEFHYDMFIETINFVVIKNYLHDKQVRYTFKISHNHF
jgi:hypothetical protein